MNNVYITVHCIEYITSNHYGVSLFSMQLTTVGSSSLVMYPNYSVDNDLILPTFIDYFLTPIFQSSYFSVSTHFDLTFSHYYIFFSLSLHMSQPSPSRFSYFLTYVCHTCSCSYFFIPDLLNPLYSLPSSILTLSFMFFLARAQPFSEPRCHFHTLE